MRILSLTLTCLVAAFSTSGAFAKSEDAAYDKGNNPVVDSRGGCVRTKWTDDRDPCAPTPPPQPVVEAPKPKPKPMPVVSQEQRTIYFEFDSYKLTPEGAAKIDQLANIVNGSKEITDVHIHGYTDQFGSDGYNATLATKRAEAVRDYFKARVSPYSGVTLHEADVKGLGKAQGEGCKEKHKKRAERIACMADQRRVEFEFKSIR
ncbi:MAG: OmpA family protein [Alphaproteobacteria bacterium]|nr:OmpA family protein [Alphaproteobacteria bacterium]